MPKRPPEWYWLPRDDSDGTKYHAKMCSKHLLEPVERDEAIARIRSNDLDPCKNCQAHYGLEAITDG